MSKPKLNEKRASAFITYDIFDKLKDAAQKKGLTVSGLIRMLILEYVNRQNENENENKKD